ncbi:MAG: type II 3-dehydroquinate dehydratase [Nitrospiraceae bacterium]|nr:type II 3-dehydroquinate dehydratase [Nitrospiraceae bacterium]
MNVLVIHGPNLNLLGKREKNIYGMQTLEDINNKLNLLASELGLKISIAQSNSEAEIIDTIQKKDFDVLIINPAAYTHTSVAIRDAIAAVDKPVIEVHISNIYKREDFRQKSYIAGVSTGQISGLGVDSYLMALRASKNLIQR